MLDWDHSCRRPTHATTSGRSGSSSSCSRRGLACAKGGGELVPVRQDRAGQRAGDRRRCERCGTAVEQRLLEQWFFRITDYAPRLLDNLDWIDWSDSTKRPSATGSAGRRERRSASRSDRATRPGRRRCSRSPVSRRGPTPSSARRTSSSRRSTRSSSDLTRAEQRAAVEAYVERDEAAGPHRRARAWIDGRRPASSPGRSRSIPRPANRFRSGSPTTC